MQTNNLKFTNQKVFKKIIHIFYKDYKITKVLLMVGLTN